MERTGEALELNSSETESIQQNDMTERTIAMKMHVRLTLIEDALGMMPGDEDILKTYLASKAPTPEKTAEEVTWCTQTEEEKRITVFPRMDDGQPMFWDYQIKGMLKDSCAALTRQGKAGSPEGTACAKIKAYKKVIDGDVFVFPRRIPIDLHGLKMDTCTRPLRADTPQGPRTSIAKSEAVPEGSTIEFYFDLAYPSLRGIGQWRNSGKGRFLWEELDNDGNVIGGNLHDET